MKTLFLKHVPHVQNFWFWSTDPCISWFGSTLKKLLNIVLYAWCTELSFIHFVIYYIFPLNFLHRFSKVGTRIIITKVKKRFTHYSITLIPGNTDYYFILLILILFILY